MSYFQNPTDAEFQGNLLLSDRQFNMTFKVKGNSPNSSVLFQAMNAAPYNVSSNTNLNINYSFDAGNTWTVLSIDVSTTALNSSAATAYEIVSALTANATFQALFAATVNQDNKGNTYPVIKALRAREKFKTYVTNGYDGSSNAENALRFNKKAGVAEFPSYFSRHTISNKSAWPDSVGMLVQLDPTAATGSPQDQVIIHDAGLTYTIGISGGTVTISNTNPFQVNDTVTIFDGTNSLDTFITAITPGASLTLNDGSWSGNSTAQIVIIHKDYQLLRGRSGIFNFQNISVDGNDRITQIIEYPAGALPGDLARIIKYVYSGSNTHPSQITEEPYTLASSDLVTP